MRARIVRIGNSQGVRLPRPLLDEVGVEPGAEVELEARAGALVLTPARRPREGWAKAFARGNKAGLLDPESPTRFDREEWSW